MEQKQISFTPTLGNIAYLLAAVAVLVVLIPVLFGCWHAAFMWIHTISGIGAVACAVAAYLKDEDKKKVVVSLILVFFSFVLPAGMNAEAYQASLVKVQKAAKEAQAAAQNAHQNHRGGDFGGF